MTKLHENLKKSHPDLMEGNVYCTTCGLKRKVDSGICLQSGWPKCCGYTMRLGEIPKEKPMDPHLKDIPAKQWWYYSCGEWEKEWEKESDSWAMESHEKFNRSEEFCNPSSVLKCRECRPELYCHSVEKPTHNPLENSGGEESSRPIAPTTHAIKPMVSRPQFNPKGIKVLRHLVGCPQQLWEPGRHCSCDLVTKRMLSFQKRLGVYEKHWVPCNWFDCECGEENHKVLSDRKISLKTVEPFIPSWDSDYE